MSKAIASTEAACYQRGWDVCLVEKELHGTHDMAMPAVADAQRAMRRESLGSSPIALQNHRQRAAFAPVQSFFYRVPGVSKPYGFARLAGLRVEMYFDSLCGCNLFHLSAYESIRRRIETGVDTVSELCSLEDLGYPPTGLPITIFMTGSIVHATKWMRTTILVTNRYGHEIELTQQLVAFLNRPTPLLVLGRDAFRLCGFLTVKDQQMLARGHSLP